MSLSSVFDIIMKMSLAGSVAAAIILLAKGVLRDKLGAVWHYAIWALLLIRLTVPVMPQSQFSIFNLFAGPARDAGYTWEWDGALPADPGQAPAQGDAQAPYDVTVPEGPAGAQTGTGADPLSIIWLGGAVAMLLYILLVNGLYAWKIRRKPRCTDTRITGILADCAFALHIRKCSALVCDTDRKAPALYGIVRPRILMDPGVLGDLTDDEVKHIFLHELAHLKRKDNVTNWAVTFVSALHWFNPVVWYAAYRMRQDREIACDAYVLNYLKPDEHKKYGETIIRLLQSLSARRWAPVAVGMAGNDTSTIKRRIKMIRMFKKPSFRWTALAVAVMLIISVVALTNSPANAKGGGPDGQPQPTPQTTPQPTPQTTPQPTPQPTPQDGTVYANSQYGFTFSLPESWQGYTIVNDTWTANPVDGAGDALSGPKFLIRHPQWTADNPREDIPVMALTIDQWNAIAAEEYHIGAAPIGPTELGRNDAYVFALPARYNFDFLTGYEEVEQIMSGTPLKPVQPTGAPESTATPWQVPVAYDLAEEQNTQDSVDQGHSPWRLSPVMVAQVFVSLQVSPDGIVGDYPIGEDEITIVSQDDASAVLAIGGDVTPTATVYLQRLIKQDDTGIWTVVGYDPVEK